MKILRTPDKYFEHLPDYDYEPSYTTIKDNDGTDIRIHCIDLGPKDADPILLMHGNPTWCYIYRNMIPELLKTGRRVIAVDLVGCGRSDKPSKRSDYSLVRHHNWMSKWLEAMNLNNISLFCQDWGGTIGLYLVSKYPEKFDRVITSNTGLPLGDVKNKYLTIWLLLMRFAPSFPWNTVLKKSFRGSLNEAEFNAYLAPFPKLKYQAGILKFPQLIAIHPDNPGVPANTAAWEGLMKFTKPFLTLFGAKDPASKGWDKKAQKHIPGAKGQPHVRLENVGHFSQEEAPQELLKSIIPFLHAKEG